VKNIRLIVFSLILIVAIFSGNVATSYAIEKSYYYDKYNSIYGYIEDPYWTAPLLVYGDMVGYTSYTFDPINNTFTLTGSISTVSSSGTVYGVDAFGLRKFVYQSGTGDSTRYLDYSKYRYDSMRGYVRFTLVQSDIVAVDGTYPDDVRAADGYWYVKNGIVNHAPTASILSPDQNQTFGQPGVYLVPKISVTDADGDTLNCSYYLDTEISPRDSKIISNTATEQDIAFNELQLDGLSEGNHTLKFEVSDNLASTVISSVDFFIDKSPPVIGSITTTSFDTAITVAGSATDDGAGLASEPYRYTIGTMISPWTADSYTFSNLTPNTSYNVNVEAIDALDHISSKQQSFFTKAQVPALTVSRTGEASVDLTFTDSNPSGTEYLVKFGGQYVSGDGTLTATLVWIAPTNKVLQVTGLQPNTAYSFQARARNALGEETAESSPVSVTTLASPPAPITTESSQRWMKLNWPEATGVTSYDVEADGSVVNNGTATTFTHTGLAPSTQHHYRVRANNAGGTGYWSPLVSTVTLTDPPAVPTDLQAVPSQTDMTVAWDIAARADSYEIEADGVVIDNGSQTTFTHSGLQPLTDHIYRIRAKNAGGTSDWSAPIVQKTLPYPPPTPEHLAAEPSIYSVALTWDAAEGAEGYEVEADNLIVDVGNTTEYTHEGLEPVSGHTYRIRAKNAGGKSPWSDPITTTTHPEKPAAPTNIISTSEDSSITLTWYQMMYIDSYDVEIDGSTVVNVDKNQFVHDGLAPDQKHTYRIRAKNISGDGPWSNPITMGTLPAGSGTTLSLTNVAAIVTNRAITISWDTVAPDAKYDIEVDGVLSDNGTDTIYHHTGLAANEFHTYKIRVKDNDNVGEWVAMLSLSTLPDPPDAPTNIEAFATTNSIELHWDKTNGATGYDVEVDGQTNELGADNAYTQQGLAPGTAHQYRVRAKNITGVTAWSPFIVKSTTSPDYLVNVSSNKTFDLSLYAYNVQDFSEKTFVVHYNPDEAEVVDLYDFTPKQDVASGNIPGSNLTATYTPGTITFKVNQNVVPGTSWSGELTTISFKAKIDGQTTINAIVQ
jgi:hypothetical protein